MSIELTCAFTKWSLACWRRLQSLTRGTIRCCASSSRDPATSLHTASRFLQAGYSHFDPGSVLGLLMRGYRTLELLDQPVTHLSDRPTCECPWPTSYCGLRAFHTKIDSQVAEMDYLCAMLIVKGQASAILVLPRSDWHAYVVGKRDAMDNPNPIAKPQHGGLLFVSYVSLRRSVCQCEVQRACVPTWLQAHTANV
jgi:hypothetical protein